MEVKEAFAFWNRALESLQDAEEITSHNGKANRSYYAAFYAVSALLALDGVSLKKHSAVNSAVHRDLVKTGRFPKELGKEYSDLFDLRLTGDYGIIFGVSEEDSLYALESAKKVVKAVSDAFPQTFKLK